MRSLACCSFMFLLACSINLLTPSEAEATRRCRHRATCDSTPCIPSWARCVDLKTLLNRNERKRLGEQDVELVCFCCYNMTWNMCNDDCPPGRKVYVEAGSVPDFRCRLQYQITRNQSVAASANGCCDTNKCFCAMVCDACTKRMRFAYPSEKKVHWAPLWALNEPCGDNCCR